MHQIINQQHGENSFVLPFHSKNDLWKKKKRSKSNVQSFGGMIKYFIKFYFPNNIPNKEVIWSEKHFSKSVNWSKFNTVFPEKYYFSDTIIWLRVSLQFENTFTLTTSLRSWGPKQSIFGNQFYSKNARKLRFHIFQETYDIIILPEADWIQEK